jgi:hypothetical protein
VALTSEKAADIQLWRAVKTAELADIQSAQAFRAAAGQAEGKYFTLSAEEAATYARGAYKAWPQEGPYWLVRTEAPKSIVGETISLPAEEIRAVFVLERDLPRLVHPVIEPVMPVRVGPGVTVEP